MNVACWQQWVLRQTVAPIGPRIGGKSSAAADFAPPIPTKIVSQYPTVNYDKRLK
jgi:hypothetical protein